MTNVLVADEILFAWGSNRVAGRVGAVLRDQVAWLRGHLKDAGVHRAWMVAGTPRHPSRRRQYVGPEKARVEGSSFEDRLAKVLAAHLLE